MLRSLYRIKHDNLNHNREKVKLAKPLHCIRCNTATELAQTLDELNKIDEEIIFETKKKVEIRDKFGPEIAENITDKLANDLLFIHRFYIQENDSSKEQRISLRKYIKSIYQLHDNIPENIHKLLIDVLIKNNALDEHTQFRKAPEVAPSVRRECKKGKV